MPFSQAERLAIAEKLAYQISGTSNAPAGEKYWYNAANSWQPAFTNPNIPVAPDTATADANAIANPEFIEKRTVHLTVDTTSNNRARMARVIHGDQTSAIITNWIQPSLYPTNGSVSSGYGIRLYDGDPNAGGTPVSTTFHSGPQGQPSWLWFYNSGIFTNSTDEATTYAGMDLWVVGYVDLQPVVGGGSGSGSGVYTQDFVLGGSYPSQNITHDLKSRDLHITLYSLPSYERIDAESTNIDNNHTIFYGDGEALLVRCVIGVGGGSGITPFDAVEIEYADLVNLVGAAGLKTGSYYKIMDFRTVNYAGLDITHTAEEEEIIVQAISEDTLDDRAYSAVHMQEILHYTIDNDSYSTHGIITYRENIDKNIKTPVDFRGVQYARRKVDVSGISSWDNGTAYVEGDTVLYNGDIWAIVHDNTGNTPSTGSYFWHLVIPDYATNYCLTNQTEFGGIEVVSDATSTKLFPMFHSWNSNTETAVFTLGSFQNIDCRSDYVIFGESGGSMNEVLIRGECNGATLRGNIRSVEFGYQSQGFVTNYSGTIINTVFKRVRDSQLHWVRNCRVGYIHLVTLQNVEDCTFGKGYNSSLGFIQRTEIQDGFNNIHIGRSTGDFIGRDATQLYIVRMNDNSFGSNAQSVRVDLGANFYGNTFGRFFKHFRIQGTFQFFHNKFGDDTGSSISDHVVHSHWYRNVFGNRCFSAGTSDIGGQCTYNITGSNLYNINVNGDFVDCSIGSNCREISTTGSINGCTIGTNCGLFDLGRHLSYCKISSGCTGITVPAGIDLKQVHFMTGVSNIDFTGATSTSRIHQNYTKEIMNRVDGSAILRYTDNSNNLVYDSIIG